jgi:putative DNA methylase
LINKAMIEIPPKFADNPPVNPEAQRQKAQMDKSWQGAQGLAEDVRYYGKWMVGVYCMRVEAAPAVLCAFAA